ncbi:Hsp70 family protein [Gulosibacter sp. 10]|uniref:Hsp70 family protein n=1 Tax=Gulosibacter sp. 10 TaxID=1255570 RepID=UPI00097EC60C|nr:Hsp70 family protein [Gulosibacter sp. 10]SJM70554.1 molecular chaperone [Gulosibacter sp. 10]
MAWRLSIDFGTSNTAAAIDAQGAIRPISLSESGTSMPSAIVLTPNGFRVGEEAVNAQLRHPDGFERSPKMLVGRGEVVLAGEIVSPNDIVREIYSYVRAAALRRQDGEPPVEVWLTHPVAWAPSQIEALREGAVAAGFSAESIRTVNEPIAAAAHYARNHRAAPGSRVAVFDFGGGTLDLAVLERAPQLPEGYRVLAYGGDPVLGGRTFDARLLDWTLETLARRGHSELADRLHRPKTMSELRAQTTLSRAVTSAKIELSTRPDADIAVSLGEEDAVVTITRKEYERLIADDLDRAGKLLNDVFDQVVGLSPEVLYLTGGSSRTPAISHMIRDRTGIRIATLDDPKLVVAEGALHVAPVGAVRAAKPLKPSHSAPSGAPIQPPAAAPTPLPFTGQDPATQPFQPQQRAPGQAPGPGGGPGGPQAANTSGNPAAPARPGQDVNATGAMPRLPNQDQRPPAGGHSAPPPHPATGQQPGHFAPRADQQRADQQRADQQGQGPAARPAAASAHGGPGMPGQQPGPQSGQPHGFAAANGPQQPAKKPKNKKLLIGGIIGAVVLVVGGIFGGIALFGNQGGEEPEPTKYDDTVVVADGPLECWDGTNVDGGENCADLTGQEALDWLVAFQGASCEAEPGQVEQKACSWYDRPNDHVYVMEFESYDAAVGYAQSLYSTDSVDWQVEGEVAGPHWEGEFTEGGGGYSHVYLWEGQPYGIFVRLDKDDAGQYGSIEDIQSRFTPRPLSEVAHAVASTDRV